MTMDANAKATLKTRLLAAGLPQKVVDRRVDRLGLTDEDVLWNQRFGRPMHWKETVDPEAEKARRDEWTRLQALQQQA